LSFFAEGAQLREPAFSYAWKSLKMGLFYGVVITVGVVLFGRIILTFYGQDYVDNGYLALIVVSASNMPSTTLSVYLSWLRISDKILLLVAVAGLDLFLGLLLSYYLMTWLGLVGAALGWLVAGLVMAFCIAILWKWQQAHLGKSHDATLRVS
jgi:O-antigen/teichoic acid export membrane protein